MMVESDGGLAPTVRSGQPERRHNTMTRIPELDGLRGVAISSVVIWHYFIAELELRGSLPAALVPFRLAWSGVDLFFVLSGFLISNVLLSAKRSPRFYRTFYVRRFFRIVPLYYALLLLIIMLRQIVPELFPDYVIPQWSYLLFLQNVSMAIMLTHGTGALGVSWSLAVEEQFYLLLPVCVRNMSVRRLYTLALYCCPVAILWRLATAHNLYAFQYLMPARVDALAVGILSGAILNDGRYKRMFLQYRTGILTSLAAGFCLMTVFDVDPLHSRTGEAVGLTWIAVFYSAMLVAAIADPESALARACRKTLLREIGQLAYFIYLFHDLIHKIIHHLLPVEPIAGFLAMPATILLAKLSWTWLEEPLIRMGHRATYTGRALPDGLVSVQNA